MELAQILVLPGLGLNPGPLHGLWDCGPVPSHLRASVCSSVGLGISYGQAARGSWCRERTLD